MKNLLLVLVLSIPLIGFGQEEKEDIIIALEDVVIIKSKAYFKKDSTLVTGHVKGFHPNGKPFIDVTMTNGDPNGVHKRWDENGTLVDLRTYKNGIKHGVQKRWDENGVLTRERMYNEGKQIEN